MTVSRGAGRPSAQVLTTNRIVAAARRLLKRQGEFTMAALAKELKVAPSSLYNHVSSRDEVLAKISDSVVRDIDVTPLQEAVSSLREGGVNAFSASLVWIEAVSAWAHSYRDAFAATPELIPHLAITPVRQAPQTLAMYEDVVSAFVKFGFGYGDALLAIEAIEAFLLGSALDASAAPTLFDPAEYAEQFPLMKRAFEEVSAQELTPDVQAFELGLQSLLLRLSGRVRVD